MEKNKNRASGFFEKLTFNVRTVLYRYMTYRFTSIINKEGKIYVAKCVELGVVSQGKSIEAANESLKEAVSLYLEDNPGVKKNISKEHPVITMFELVNA